SDAAYLAVLEQLREQSSSCRPAAVDKTAPVTPMQRVVAEVWAEALCRDAVGVHADLFAIGGNSRTALEVSAQLSEIFRVDIPGRLMFDLPTVADQAAHLAEIDLSCAHSLAGIAQRLLDYEVTFDDAPETR